MEGRKFRGVDLYDPLAVGPEKGRLQQVICFKAEDETGGWIWRR